MIHLPRVSVMDTAAALAEVRKIINHSINIDVLIDLVKERPVIWDRSAEGYRNKDYSIYAWEQIFRILFDSYDSWGEDQKIYVGKMVKQKWTTARDVWQRTYKKRKETMPTGENASEFKDNARYEKLKFLARIYEKYDNLQSTNEGKIIQLDDNESPASPDAENENINLYNANLQNDLIRCFINKKPQNHTFNTPQKRKHESNGVSNGQLNEQGTSSLRTTVVNVEDRIKVGDLLKASKRRMSSNDATENEKNNKIQSSSHQVMSSPRREEIAYPPNNESAKNNLEQISSQASKSPSHLFKQENSSDSTAFNHNSAKVSEPDVEQGQSKRPADNGNPQIEHFFQYFRTELEHFDKSQIMQVLFDILKPLIADFDRQQLMSFKIEALHLISNMEKDIAPKTDKRNM